MATKQPKEAPQTGDDEQEMEEEAQAEAQGAEPEGGAEESEGGGEGVTVSEEFQKKAHGLIHKASKHEAKHLRDRVSAREDELRQEEMKSQKGKTPSEFSASDMPS